MEDLTVKDLKRQLKLHKLPVTGKKNILKARYEKHVTNCKCSLADDTQQLTSQPAIDGDFGMEHFIKHTSWKDDLTDFPSLTISSIHAYKATDKHLKQGYNLFKCGKVENMPVGKYNEMFLCQGRIAPSMKKQRYKCLVRFTGLAVTGSECTCPAGKGKCKHSMAVLFALTDLLMTGTEKIPEALACTSKPQAWGRVSAKPVDIKIVKDFSDLAPRVVCYDPDNPAGRYSEPLLFSIYVWKFLLFTGNTNNFNIQHKVLWCSVIE